VYLLVYSASRLLAQRGRGEPPSMAQAATATLSLALLFLVGVFVSQLKVAIISIYLVTGAGLALLVWVIRSFAAGIRNKRAPKLGQCVLLFVALTFVDLFVCLWILLDAALSHSQRAKERVPLECLLSFILIAVLPTAGMLLFRYHRGSRGRVD